MPRLGNILIGTPSVLAVRIKILARKDMSSLAIEGYSFEPLSLNRMSLGRPFTFAIGRCYWDEDIPRLTEYFPCQGDLLMLSLRAFEACHVVCIL